MWPFQSEKKETITLHRPGREEEKVAVFVKNGAQYVKIQDAFGYPFEIEAAHLFQMGVVVSHSDGVKAHPRGPHLTYPPREETVDAPQETLRLLSRAVTDVTRFAMQDGHGIVEAACSDAALRIVEAYAAADKVTNGDINKLVADTFDSLVTAAAPVNGNGDYTATVVDTFASTFVRHMPATDWAKIAKEHLQSATSDVSSANTMRA
jgi:hypothetical protein